MNVAWSFGISHSSGNKFHNFFLCFFFSLSIPSQSGYWPDGHNSSWHFWSHVIGDIPFVLAIAPTLPSNFKLTCFLYFLVLYNESLTWNIIFLSIVHADLLSVCFLISYFHHLEIILNSSLIELSCCFVCLAAWNLYFVDEKNAGLENCPKRRQPHQIGPPIQFLSSACLLLP